MQPERTAGCDQPAEPDRRRCQGQAAPGKLGAQRQGGERNRRSVGWRSFGIHEGTVPADDGCRGQDQAGRCDYGVSAAAARQEKRGSCREEEGRGVKNRDSGGGGGRWPSPRGAPPRAVARRKRLPHLWSCYRWLEVVLELASIRLNIKRSTGLAVALASLRARKHCWTF